MVQMIDVQDLVAQLPDGEITRLFHGRGRQDQLAAVVIDWFSPVIALRLYEPTDLEQTLVQQLVANTSDDVRIVVQRRWLRDDAWQWVKGQPIPELVAKCADVNLQVRIGSNQNVGVFHDMAPVHSWVAERAQGKRLLNLFSYTCAFSVAALNAGAQTCVNVDMAGGALNTGRENHRLNGIDRGAKFLKMDVLKSFGRFRREGPFDLVIADPPSFQRNSFEAKKHYAKLLNRLGEVLTETGEVLFCLNDPGVAEEEFKQWIVDSGKWQVIERLAAAQSFVDSSGDTALKVMRCKPL